MSDGTIVLEGDSDRRRLRMIIVDDRPELQAVLRDNEHYRPVMELELGHAQAERIITRARELLQGVSHASNALVDTEEHLRRIPVKLPRGVVRYCDVRDIDWFEAANQYVQLHVGSDTYLVRLSMTFLVSRLEPRQFQRIHRSTIVNLNRIKELCVDDRTRRWAVLQNGYRLQVSQRNWERLHRAMQGLTVTRESGE